MIQTQQFQEEYNTWNTETQLHDYIKSLVPEDMNISEETITIITSLVTQYTLELTKQLLDVMEFDPAPKKQAGYIEMILHRNDNRIRKQVKKDYFINTTFSDQR